MSFLDIPDYSAGLGLRRSLLVPLSEQAELPIDFMEISPENWMGLGGRLGKQFAEFSERYPMLCHGLSLSVGGLEPLDIEFIGALKQFLDQHNIRHYSEHLSYCTGDGGHLYDLMPMAFTEESVLHVAGRIKEVQNRLERRISVENISYYATLPGDLTELEFIRAVLAEADCGLLLDVNNIYVNSINHDYDPYGFLYGLPANRVEYIHVAGHFDEAPDLKIDTHGCDVIEPVWKLLAVAYQHVGLKPTLLERDFNTPPLPLLMAELTQVRDLACAHVSVKEAISAATLGMGSISL